MGDPNHEGLQLGRLHARMKEQLFNLRRIFFRGLGIFIWVGP